MSVSSSSSPQNNPQNCGYRLIPKLVDEIAQTDPQRPFISVPRSARVEDGFVDITYRQFAAAINRCCWWLDRQLGCSKTFDTLFYFGPLDYRHFIVVLAAAKTGHVAFLSSHRNSLEAHLSLLEATRCQVMLLAAGAPAISQDILVARPMQVITVPDIEYLMMPDEDQAYQWHATFSEMRDRSFLILHTSGSTGIPKPVFVAHGTFASNDAHQLIPALGGKPTLIDHFTGKRFFIAFPPFHAANIFFTIGYNVFSKMVCVLPPLRPITADVVHQIHTYGKLDGSVLPPSLIIDIYNTSEYYANTIQRLQFLAYVGGSMPKEVGDSISAQMKLITLMGSTENGYLPVEIIKRNQDWQKIPISPYLGHEFRPSRDGLNELVIVRKQELSLFQGVFYTFPNIDEYSTSDLYEREFASPEGSNSWVFRARSDDIISFTTAEKLNPVTMETLISSHPAVNAALIAGQGEFQAALVIEPKIPVHTFQEREIMRQTIWPTVMEANRSCPAHGRILKEYIMFTTPAKPLPQAAKGTVQRYAALKLYDSELKALYGSTKEPVRQPPDSLDGQPKAVDERSTAFNMPVEPAAPVDQAIPPAFLSLDGNARMASEIDARIEKILKDLLPTMFSQYLRPAFIRMMTDLLQPGSPQSHAPDQNKERMPNGLNHDTPPNAMIASGDGYSHSDLNKMEMSKEHRAVPAREDTNLRYLQDGLRQVIANTTYLHGLNDAANFFDCGLDSLQVSALVKEINGLLRNMKGDVAEISAKSIYESPSIELLLPVLQERVGATGAIQPKG